MNEKEYQFIQQTIKQLVFMLEKTGIGDDNYSPLKSAIVLLRFIKL